MIAPVTGKQNLWPAALFVLALALTRLLVGVVPPGFSPLYAMAFCGAVFFGGALAWWIPLGTLFATDILLNLFFYERPAFGWFMLINYLAFAVIILLGRRFKPGDSWLKLLGGGLLGAVLFYLITNSASWLTNPVYAKTLAGWWQALTTGEPGHPPTWMFFKNTLLSGGLFTGLFAGAMKFTEAREPQDEPAEEPEPEPAGAETEQAKP